MKKTYFILSKDDHRDDIVYLFTGTFKEAKEKALEELKSMRNYEIEEGESEESNALFWASMCYSTYCVIVGLPERIN